MTASGDYYYTLNGCGTMITLPDESLLSQKKYLCQAKSISAKRAFLCKVKHY